MTKFHIPSIALVASLAAAPAFADTSPAAAPAKPTATSAKAAPSQDPAVREIQVHAEKIGDVVHWEPETIVVHPGEKIRFLVKDDMVGGADFHGFSIKELNIAKQVNRGVPLIVDATIPATMKTGELKIFCQFHPKHAPAMLKVESKAQEGSRGSDGAIIRK